MAFAFCGTPLRSVPHYEQSLSLPLVASHAAKRSGVRVLRHSTSFRAALRTIFTARSKPRSEAEWRSRFAALHFVPCRTTNSGTPLRSVPHYERSLLLVASHAAKRSGVRVLRHSTSFRAALRTISRHSTSFQCRTTDDRSLPLVASHAAKRSGVRVLRHSTSFRAALRTVSRHSTSLRAALRTIFTARSKPRSEAEWRSRFAALHFVPCRTTNRRHSTSLRAAPRTDGTPSLRAALRTTALRTNRHPHLRSSAPDCITPFHASRLTLHASRFTFHVSRFTFHVSRSPFHPTQTPPSGSEWSRRCRGRRPAPASPAGAAPLPGAGPESAGPARGGRRSGWPGSGWWG